MTIWAIVAVILLMFLWQRGRGKGIKIITADELKAILKDKDKIFIDVRTPNEYKARHIPQFRNIPLGSDFSIVPKEKEVVVICQSGMRSAKACRLLKKLGYEKVTNVKGGMNAWRG